MRLLHDIQIASSTCYEVNMFFINKIKREAKVPGQKKCLWESDFLSLGQTSDISRLTSKAFMLISCRNQNWVIILGPLFTWRWLTLRDFSPNFSLFKATFFDNIKAIFQRQNIFVTEKWNPSVSMQNSPFNILRSEEKLSFTKSWKNDELPFSGILKF